MVNKITSSNIIGTYLNDYGKKYYLRELAELLKKPHQTIKPHLEALVKDKVLIKNKRKNITEYSLNLKDNKIYEYLVISEKNKLLEKLKKETYLLVLFERLSAFFTHNSFIIFGSAAEEIKKGSDIDILIVGKESKDLKKVIEDFKEIYNKKTHTIRVNKIQDLTQTLLIEVYKKHIIFNNTENIIRFLGKQHEKNRLV